MNKKKSISISIISVPASYIIAVILSAITASICNATRGIIPVLKFDLAFFAIFIVFNVIAIIKAFEKKQ